MKKKWNSKILVIALVAVLLASFALTGCQQQPTETQGNETTAPTESKPAETTKPTEPPEEPFEVYWNLDKLTYMPEDNTDGVSTRKADADGNYSVNFVYKGKVTTKKVKGDAALINKIDSLFVIGELTVDASDVVTGIKTVEEVGGKILTSGTYVSSYNGTVLVVNEAADFTGKKDTYKVEYSTYVLDVMSDKVANLYEMFSGDRLVAVADKKGETSHIFVFSPSEIRVGKVAYCDHCQQEVTWTAWTDSKAFPVSSSGHYYLYQDISVKSQQSMTAGAQLILDLNGKTIERTTGKEEDTTGRLISVHNPECYLAIMDYSETKTGTIKNFGDVGALGGCVWVRDGQFDFYGGTINASASTNSSRGAAVHVSTDKVFNMYGGTIIGTTTESAYDENGKLSGGGYGGSVFADGTFNMYDGVIKGGIAKSIVIDGVVSRGAGGNVGVGAKGVFNMSGGKIFDGTADNGDANLYVAEGGVFNHTGGTIGE